MDTLLIIITSSAADLRQRFSHENVAFTELSARGGFSRKKLSLFYVGVSSSEKQRVLDLVKEMSSSQKEVISGFTPADDSMVEQALVSAISTTSTKVNGATVFEIPMTASYKF